MPENVNCFDIQKDKLPRLLTPDEVADLLRKSRKAIYIMKDRGQLPGVVRIGRLLRFRTQDLIKWLDKARVPSPTSEVGDDQD